VTASIRITSIAILAALFVGCSHDQSRQVKRAIDPAHPKKAATHVVTLKKVQFGAEDFNLNSFGNPLNIEVILREDGNRIPPIGTESIVLDGKRGERLIRSKIQWAVNFDPTRNYQVVLEEKAIIANARVWSLPGTPKIGYWPIGENNGKLIFGRDSYIAFSDKIAQ